MPGLARHLEALAPGAREAVTLRLLRDAVDDQRDAWHFKKLVDAVSAGGAVPPDVLSAYEHRRAEDRHTYTPLGADPPAPDPQPLIAGRDFT